MKRVSTPIAIVGMACRFAGKADSPDRLWRNIESKRSGIEPIPENRWASELFDRLESSESTQFAKVGGFIESLEGFDAAFFDITEREAQEIDPQQRILLELAWQCMQDASISPERLQSIVTAVYAGVINHDYERLLLSNRDRISSYTGLGRAASIAANRISHAFHFTGASVTLDTACSSSLAAIDSACQALDNETADAAFAGGANVIALPESYIEFSRASMLSKSGRCSAFDDRADGFVRAEGGGMVLLKRLADALVDGDRIHGVIVSTAMNQDGRTAGLMAPSKDAQKNMMRLALEHCELSANEIGYVEAHGTGTQAGDVIEAQSIGEVYGGESRSAALPIGSIKTNIGHTESAAGIAGVIKAVLAVKNAIIPPNLNFLKPNRNIDFEKLRLRIPVEPEPWVCDNGKRRAAAINSFGFGGTNAHAIVTQVPVSLSSVRSKTRPPLLVPVSAASQNRLDQRKGALKRQIEKRPEAAENLSHTAGRQPALQYRGCLICDKNSDISETVLTAACNRIESLPESERTHQRKLAFVFNGLGRQSSYAGSQLYKTESVFRSVTDLCDSILQRRYQIKCIEEFFAHNTLPSSDDIVSVHCLHFTLQIALYELWVCWNVQPTAVIGHSLGEIAAACAAGCVSITDAVRIVVRRSESLKSFSNQGGMLAAAITKDQALDLIDQHKDQLFLAAENSEKSVTFTGASETIQLAAHRLRKSRIFFRLLETSVPFHSKMIDGAKDEFISSISDIAFKQPRHDWFSSVCGKAMDVSEIDDEFWWDNFRTQVRFRDAMDAAIENGIRNFVEIGAHPTLSYSILECLQTNGIDGRHFNSLRQNCDDSETMRTSAAELFCSGVPVDWQKINPRAQTVDIAGHHWERKRFWVHAKERLSDSSVRFDSSSNTPVLIPSDDCLCADCWELKTDVQQFSWLRSHRIYGRVVFPAAGYIESALEAAQRILGTSFLEVSDIEFRQMLSIDAEASGSEQKYLFEVSDTDRDSRLSFAIRSDSQSQPTVYCRGVLLAGNSIEFNADATIEKFANATVTEIPHKLFDELEKLGIQGDRDSWLIREAKQFDDSELLAQIEAAKPGNASDSLYLLHPSLLDLCFRMSWLLCRNSKEIYLPVKIKQLMYSHQPTGNMQCHIKIKAVAKSSVEADVTVFGESDAIAQVRGLQLRSLGSSATAQSYNDPKAVIPQWVPAQPTASLKTWFQSVSDSHCQLIEKLCESLSNRYQRQAYYDHIADQLTRITLSFIGECFRVGGLSNQDDRVTVGELKNNLAVADGQVPFLFLLLDLLRQTVFIRIEQKNDGSRLACRDSLLALRDLPTNSSHTIAEFMTEFDSSRYLSEVALTERCGRNLLEVLQGKNSALDILFPKGDMTDLSKFYRNSPTCLVYNEIIAASVENLLAEWTYRRPLRILEIGGGTGAVLFHIEHILTDGTAEYTFTDISSSFVRQARRNFGHLKNIRFRQFDLNADPQVQGYQKGQFDVVVANDVLHLAAELDDTMSAIRDLLAPGGFLLFCETINPPQWAHLVFGMLLDWSNATKMKTAALDANAMIEFWRKSLISADFECIDIAADFVHADAPLHAVFLAQSCKTQNFKRVETVSDTDTIIFCDGSEFSDQFASRFHDSKTLRVTCNEQFAETEYGFSIRPLEVSDYIQMLRSIAEKDDQADEIIVLWNFVAAQSLGTELFELRIESSFTAMLSCLVQAFDKLTMTLPRLTFVSSNVHQIGGISNLSHCFNAEIWSAGRAIRNEYPHLQCRLVDIDENSKSSLDTLIKFIAESDGATEASIRGSDLYVPAFRALDPNEIHGSRTTNQSLVCTEPGSIDSLAFSPVGFPAPSKSEVVIEVDAAALNFRDVMVTLDALDENAVSRGAAGRNLGIECAGVVARAGDQVKNLEIGDRVVALSPAALSRFVCVDKKFAYPVLSDAVDLRQAAGIPVALITGIYSFGQIPDNLNKSSILIHSASGGVGLMLIWLARQRGMRIFATAGSNEKARVLNLMGVDCVSDSRSERFVNDVLRWTDGQGVDIVINTLGGELARANQHVLNKSGAFIELGKYKDQGAIHDDIRCANATASIHVIDIDRLWKEDPEQISSLLHDSMKMIETQKLPLPPIEMFTAGRIEQAFKSMASARHIGKIVISMKDRPYAQFNFSSRNVVHKDATYLVSGGAGGFGLATVKWLSQNGAEHIITINRNEGDSPEFQQAKLEMERSGTVIHHVACDITEFSALQKTLKQSLDSLPPVRGVFHCAMEIHDCALTQLDNASYLKSAHAKVIGAQNLYRLTKRLKLDYFVMYSSVTSLIGPAGQSAYAAANAFIDSFARYLRHQEVNAVSVNWGAVSDYGYVAAHPQHCEAMNIRYGVAAHSAEAMLNELEKALEVDQSSPQVAIAGGRWMNLLNGHDITTDVAENGNSTFAKQFDQTPRVNDASAPNDAAHCVYECISSVVGISKDEIEPEQAVADFGIDSLQAVELSHQLRTRSGIHISATSLLESISVDELINLR